MMSDGKVHIGVALVVAASALVFSACGGGGKHDADATATAVVGSPIAATATSPASRCPVDAGVCDFAREIEGLLVGGRYGAVVDRTHTYDYTCPGDRPRGAGDPFPLCSGATTGERRSGYSVGALQSEGYVESRDGLIELLRRWIAGDRASTTVPGTGPLLATVGCPLVEAAAACGERFALVFTRGDGVSLLRLGVQRDGAGGAAQISQTLTGVIVVNPTMISGGDDSLPAVFGVQESVGTRYFLLD